MSIYSGLPSFVSRDPFFKPDEKLNLSRKTKPKKIASHNIETDRQVKKRRVGNIESKHKDQKALASLTQTTAKALSPFSSQGWDFPFELSSDNHLAEKPIKSAFETPKKMQTETFPDLVDKENIPPNSQMITPKGRQKKTNAYTKKPPAWGTPSHEPLRPDSFETPKEFKRALNEIGAKKIALTYQKLIGFLEEENNDEHRDYLGAMAKQGFRAQFSGLEDASRHLTANEAHRDFAQYLAVNKISHLPDWVQLKHIADRHLKDSGKTHIVLIKNLLGVELATVDGEQKSIFPFTKEQYLKGVFESVGTACLAENQMKKYYKFIGANGKFAICCAIRESIKLETHYPLFMLDWDGKDNFFAFTAADSLIRIPVRVVNADIQSKIPEFTFEEDECVRALYEVTSLFREITGLKIEQPIYVLLRKP